MFDDVKQKINETFKIFGFKFLPETHQYFLNGIELLSTTKYTKQFYKEFDPTGQILFACAKKANCTPWELKKKWNANGMAKAQIGTDVHEVIDNYQTNGVIHEFSETYPIHKSRMESFWNLHKRELCKLKLLESELRIFSLRWLLGGSIDSIYFIDDKLSVFDWKTNEELKDYKTYLKPPFSDLRDNDLHRYSLQLGIYSLILQEAGFEVGDSYIAWLGCQQGELLKCVDLKERLKGVLNDTRRF